MEYKEVINKLRSLSNPKNVEGMTRFGINPENTFGISIPDLRKLAKQIGKDHNLALQLWKSGYHEARILAGMIDVPELVTEAQMDSWIKDFNSWDLCDQVCMNLFGNTIFAFEKAIEWTKLKPEFEKRAGFALMAVLAWHDKKEDDKKFLKFLPYIKSAATDERNYVKKAVNWALRQIGKRSLSLREQSKKLAEDIIRSYPNSKSAKWIARDAIRELTRN